MHETRLIFEGKGIQHADHVVWLENFHPASDLKPNKQYGMITESHIFFELNLPQALNKDQKILLVGNIPELGSWSLING